MSEETSELFPEIELKGMDWANDELFFTYSFVDETSNFDPKGRWNYGCECYERIYRCRIPTAFRECQKMIDRFICMMTDEYPDVKEFWVDTDNHGEGLRI